jgi:hypothetical protein
MRDTRGLQARGEQSWCRTTVAQGTRGVPIAELRRLPRAETAGEYLFTDRSRGIFQENFVNRLLGMW